jgi:hypothetical protein
MEVERLEPPKDPQDGIERVDSLLGLAHVQRREHLIAAQKGAGLADERIDDLLQQQHEARRRVVVGGAAPDEQEGVQNGREALRQRLEVRLVLQP